MPSVPSSGDRRLARFLSVILHWTISGCNTTLCETGRGRKRRIGAIYSIRTRAIQLDNTGARKAARPPFADGKRKLSRLLFLRVLGEAEAARDANPAPADGFSAEPLFRRGSRAVRADACASACRAGPTACASRSCD